MAEPNVLIRHKIEFTRDENTNPDHELLQSCVSDHKLRAVETKDAETEATVETDNIHISTEIYSATDLPFSFETNKQLRSICGSRPLEYHDGKCIILHSTRSKNETTEDLNVTDHLLSLNCTFPLNISEKKQDPQIDTIESSFKKQQNDFRNEGWTVVPETEKDAEAKHWPLCPRNCPNLVINQTIQTEPETIVCTAPEDQVNNGEINSTKINQMVKQSASSYNTAAATVNLGDKGPVRSQSTNLTIIKEEGDVYVMRASELNILARVRSDTTQNIEYTISITRIEKNNKKWSVDDNDQSYLNKECNGYTQYDLELSNKEMDNHPDTVQMISCSKESFNTHSRRLSSSINISNKEASKETSNTTQDVGIDAVALDSAEDEVVYYQKQRKSSMYRSETGTIIQAIYSVDSQKRQKCFKESRKNKRDKNCPPSKMTGACRITSGRLVQCDAKNKAGSNRSSCNQLKSGEYFDAHCNLYNRCVTSVNRFCNEESSKSGRTEEICPVEHCSSKSNSTFGLFREPFMRDQLYRINNSKGCSMAGESFENCTRNRPDRYNACNQYYSNFNKAGSTAGEWNSYWCSNGYSVQRPCVSHCAATSPTICYMPSYYYSFNTWC